MKNLLLAGIFTLSSLALDVQEYIVNVPNNFPVKNKDGLDNKKLQFGDKTFIFTDYRNIDPKESLSGQDCRDLDSMFFMEPAKRLYLDDSTKSLLIKILPDNYKVQDLPQALVFINGVESALLDKYQPTAVGETLDNSKFLNSLDSKNAGEIIKSGMGICRQYSLVFDALFKFYQPYNDALKKIYVGIADVNGDFHSYNIVVSKEGHDFVSSFVDPTFADKDIMMFTDDEQGNRKLLGDALSTYDRWHSRDISLVSMFSDIGIRLSQSKHFNKTKGKSKRNNVWFEPFTLRVYHHFFDEATNTDDKLHAGAFAFNLGDRAFEGDSAYGANPAYGLKFLQLVESLAYSQNDVKYYISKQRYALGELDDEEYIASANNKKFYGDAIAAVAKRRVAKMDYAGAVDVLDRSGFDFGCEYWSEKDSLNFAKFELSVDQKIFGSVQVNFVYSSPMINNKINLLYQIYGSDDCYKDMLIRDLGSLFGSIDTTKFSREYYTIYDRMQKQVKSGDVPEFDDYLKIFK